MNMLVRRAALDDLDDVFVWRNDPLIRKMGKHNAPVSYEEHQAWFQMSLKNPERLMYIGQNSEKVGIIRFDRKHDGAWEVSLYAAPVARGTGVGRQLLKQGLLHLEMEKKPTKVIAEIREENSVSQDMFKRFLFRETKRENGFVFYELKFPRMGPLAV